MLDKLILFIAQRKLQPIKDLRTHPLYNQYQKYLPLLNRCYSEAHYWHGTGRFHYKLKGKSKYAGVDNSQTFDVLDSIIQCGGLAPKYDPFILVDGKLGESISLSPFRIYARAYAEFNQNENANLEYTYGSTKFWFYFLGILQLLEGNFLTNFKKLRYMQTNQAFIKKSQPWFYTFIKDSNKFQWKVTNFHKLRSDNSDNYGMLFGIKKEGVHLVHFDPVIERFEARSGKLIMICDLTHLEVPLNKVKQTEEFLEKKKVNLPVIPLEVSELYCNRFSLKVLSGIS